MDVGEVVNDADFSDWMGGDCGEQQNEDAEECGPAGGEGFVHADLLIRS
jgi:hypothetical protein